MDRGDGLSRSGGLAHAALWARGTARRAADRRATANADGPGRGPGTGVGGPGRGPGGGQVGTEGGQAAASAGPGGAASGGERRDARGPGNAGPAAAGFGCGSGRAGESHTGGGLITVSDDEPAGPSGRPAHAKARSSGLAGLERHLQASHPPGVPAAADCHDPIEDIDVPLAAASGSGLRPKGCAGSGGPSQGVPGHEAAAAPASAAPAGATTTSAPAADTGTRRSSGSTESAPAGERGAASSSASGAAAWPSAVSPLPLPNERHGDAPLRDVRAGTPPPREPPASRPWHSARRADGRYPAPGGHELAGLRGGGTPRPVMRRSD